MLFRSLLALLTLASCGSPQADEPNGIDSYSQVSGSFTQADSNTLTGVGSILFTNVLPGQFSKNSLALKADLLYIGSSVTAIFNSNNSLMNSSSGGIAITFTRNGATTEGTIAVNGTSVTINPVRINFYVPSAIDVIIDIHNISSTSTRVMIWQRDLTVYSPTNADVDTTDSSDYTGTYPTNTSGQGIFAGLALNNATVTAANVSIAKSP